VDTEYVAEMSVQEDLGNAFGPSEYRAGVLSATFTALTPNTTYWVRARGKNRAGVLTTGYGRWDPHATDAAAPVLGATGFTLYTDSGTVTWGVGGNPEGTRYEVLLTTGVVIGGVETRTFYWDQVGVVDQRYELPQDLIKNKEYRVRVDAVGHNTKRVSSAERSGTTNSDKPGNVDLVVNGGNPTRGLVLTWDRNGER
jgi:hypothetical protein